MLMNTVILHLCLINGIGPVTIKYLIDQLGNTPLESLYFFTVVQIQDLGISLKNAQAIVEGLKNREILEKELELYKKYTINWATCNDVLYPEMLRHIYAPPSIISWRGDIAYDKAIAVVGSRDATQYGKQAVDYFVPQLVENGYTIVSGGAYGIDAWAHEAALQAGGKTIVVVGSGLAKLYPKEHVKLFDRVVDCGGALVSIFPVMTSATPGNFPARNRVIAGLSQGVVVVQAALQSGARITADYALQQGRSVFGLPGPFNHRLSDGCHELIKQGATLLTSFDDIAQEFGITQYRKTIMNTDSSIDRQESETIKNLSVCTVAIEKTEKLPCDENLHPIVAACKIPQSFDDLIKMFPEHNSADLQNLLFDLSLEGLIEQDFSGMWKKCQTK